MTEQQNVNVVKECYAAFDRHDIPTILKSLTEDVDWYTPDSQQTPFAGHYKGPDQVGEFLKKLEASIALDKFEAREFIGHGDMVVVLGYEKGTAKETGKKAESEWAHVMTMRDGKVATFREHTDTAKIAEAFHK